jgi:SAM-dependent methyltransferase
MDAHVTRPLRRVESVWPEGFARVPDAAWVRKPIEELALKYDTVEGHGWYRNLDKTVEDLARFVRPGHLVLDYSGGTGILAARLLEELDERDFGILIVDASPKFLRLAHEKFGGHDRVAFRLIEFLKDEKRLQRIPEVVEPALLERGVDAIVSTNAIHLYYDLDATLESWNQVLGRGGKLFIQSGNIGRPDMPEGTWIIDETVEAIHRAAIGIASEDPTWSEYRPVLADAERMARYDSLRRKYFLPVRPLRFYEMQLAEAGFSVDAVSHRLIEAHVDQWYEFLAAYHEGVLGWVGGSRRVEGEDPAPEKVEERLALMRAAMERVFEGRPSFLANWTYVNASRA